MVMFFSSKTCFWRPTALSRLVRGLFGLLLVVLGVSQGSAAPKFEASLDRTNISLGESVTLSLNFTDCAPQGQPNLPQFPGLQCIGPPNASQQTSFSDGKVASIVNYTYEMRPTREGTITIPALTIQIQGTPMSSKALTLTVAKGNVPVVTGAPEAAYVRITPPSRPLFVGETVALDIRCYYQSAQEAQLPQLSGDGYRLGNVIGPQRAGQVAINNTTYNQVVYRVPFTATKSGVVKIGPATWSVTLLYGRPDFLGRYSQGQARNESFASDAPEIQVLPLPDNAPAGFSGNIGTFVLDSYDASPTNVSVGDPITIKIRISGQGPMDMVNPTQSPQDWREFKTYPSTGKTESNDPLQLSGSKNFEQVVTPQNAGITELPAFEFTYFDPQKKAYNTLRHPAVPLTVKPTAATPQPTVISKEAAPSDIATSSQEIVHIKPELGKLTPIEKPLLQQTGFLALQALAPLAWLGAIAWKRQKEKLANNPRLRRQREVARIVRDGLKELPALATANKTEEFYATVFRLLQEQLGERLDLPSSAITEAVLEDLHSNGIDAETLGSLRELFHLCNQFRYAPEYAKQELGSLIPKVEKALKNLQAVKPMSSGKMGTQIATCLAILLTTSSVFAEIDSKQAVGTAFHAANGLYEKGNYSEAAAAYEKILQGNQMAAPSLYFNLGNAYLKAGKSGRAILAFRKAEKMAPRDPDVRANLKFARNQLGNVNSALPGSRWTRWMDRMTLNEWTIMTSSVVAVFFLVLAVRQLFPKTKIALKGSVLLLGIVAIALAICLSIVISNQLATQGAVVTVPEAVVRRGPFVESQSVFAPRDGTELLVVGTQKDWMEVVDSAKRTGWVRQSDVEIVR